MNILGRATSILRSGPVLVTGAGGFLGRNLIDHLLRIGADTVIVVRKIGPRLAEIPRSVRVIEGDLAKDERLAAAIRSLKPSVVFHLAATVVSSAPTSSVIQSNVLATANLLDAVAQHPLQQFVYVGTGSEYGAGVSLSETSPLRPNNIYGATKAAAHLLTHCYRRDRGLPAISVRPFTTYGPWEPPRRLIPFVSCCALDGIEIPLTGAEQQRDFVYIDDLMDALIRVVACVGTDETEVINVCSGQPVMVKEIVNTIVALSGGRAVPRFGALPYRPGDAWVESGDPSLAQRLLGWSPRIALSDGLALTVAWIARNRALLQRLR